MASAVAPPTIRRRSAKPAAPEGSAQPVPLPEEPKEEPAVVPTQEEPKEEDVPVKKAIVKKPVVDETSAAPTLKKTMAKVIKEDTDGEEEEAPIKKTKKVVKTVKVEESDEEESDEEEEEEPAPKKKKSSVRPSAKASPRSSKKSSDDDEEDPYVRSLMATAKSPLTSNSGGTATTFEQAVARNIGTTIDSKKPDAITADGLIKEHGVNVDKADKKPHKVIKLIEAAAKKPELFATLIETVAQGRHGVSKWLDLSEHASKDARKAYKKALKAAGHTIDEPIETVKNGRPGQTPLQKALEQACAHKDPKKAKQIETIMILYLKAVAAQNSARRLAMLLVPEDEEAEE